MIRNGPWAGINPEASFGVELAQGLFLHMVLEPDLPQFLVYPMLGCHLILSTLQMPIPGHVWEGLSASLYSLELLNRVSLWGWVWPKLHFFINSLEINSGQLVGWDADSFLKSFCNSLPCFLASEVGLLMNY